MKQRFVLFITMALCNILIAPANQISEFEVSSLRQEGRKAYEHLNVAAIFSIGPVGYGATTSENELALRALLKEAEAIAALRDLLLKASTEGKLFALYGLYVKDRTLFEREIERLNESQNLRDTVHTQSGCIIMPEETQSVIARFKGGFYDQYFKQPVTSR